MWLNVADLLVRCPHLAHGHTQTTHNNYGLMASSPTVPRPDKSVTKWSDQQVVRFIRRGIQVHGTGWLEIVQHSSDRMTERQYDLEEVFETIARGSVTQREDGEHPITRLPDTRVKLEFAKRTTTTKVVVAISDHRDDAVLVTVLPKTFSMR